MVKVVKVVKTKSQSEAVSVETSTEPGTALVCPKGIVDPAQWAALDSNEQKALSLIVDLRKTAEGVVIETYYGFADKWDVTFGKNGRYKYGEAVDKVCKIIGIDRAQVYAALRTTAAIPRAKMEAMVKKAENNGVTLSWSHFKTIAGSFSDDKANLDKFSQLITEQQIGIHPLEKMISSEKPEITSESHGGGGGHGKSGGAYQFLLQVINKGDAILSDLQNIDDSIGDEPDERTLEQISKWSEAVSQAYDVFKEAKDTVDKLEETVIFLANKDEHSRKIRENEKAVQVSAAAYSGKKRGVKLDNGPFDGEIEVDVDDELMAEMNGIR